MGRISGTFNQVMEHPDSACQVQHLLKLRASSWWVISMDDREHVSVGEILAWSWWGGEFPPPGYPGAAFMSTGFGSGQDGRCHGASMGSASCGTRVMAAGSHSEAGEPPGACVAQISRRRPASVYLPQQPSASSRYGAGGFTLW